MMLKEFAYIPDEGQVPAALRAVPFRPVLRSLRIRLLRSLRFRSLRSALRSVPDLSASESAYRVQKEFLLLRVCL